MVKVNFSEADLTGSDFANVRFEDCHLDGVITDERTRFDGADLRGAQISFANLAEASLTGAVVSASQAHHLLLDRFGIVVTQDL